jgi:hypothetical protein
MGDSAALVTHKSGIKAAYADGCVIVKSGDGWTDYIIRSPKPVQVNCGGLDFKGTSGAVRVLADGAYSLALFDGSILAYNDIIIETESESEKPVAVSLCDFRAHTIEGRVVSLFDARIRVTRENSDDGIYINGEKAVSDENGYVFVQKGEHKLSLTQEGHLPVPGKARIVHIATGSGQAVIKWMPVGAAESYKIELSRDGGKTWQYCGCTTYEKYELDDLENEKKYHFRATAQNHEHSGEMSHEYPAFVSKSVPLPPDGLALTFTAEGIRFSWGEILGANEYILYARRTDEEFQTIYKGKEPKFIFRKADKSILQYAAAAVNLNGEGSLSNTIDDNPESLANWSPCKDSFDRNSLYNHHPFYALNIHQCKPSPEQYPAGE